MDPVTAVLKQLAGEYTGGVAKAMSQLAPDPGTQTVDLSDTPQVRAFREAVVNARIEDSILKQFADVLKLAVDTYIRR